MRWSLDIWWKYQSPLSTRPPLLWAERTGTNVTLSGLMPSDTIWWKSSKASPPWLGCPRLANIALHVTKSLLSILLKMLWASITLPHLTYMSMRPFLTRMSDSSEVATMLPWSNLAPCRDASSAHGLHRQINSTGSGSMPSCCIWWKTFTASTYMLCSLYALIIAVHEMTLWTFILSKICWASCKLPHLANMLTRAVAMTTSVPNPALTNWACTHFPWSKAYEIAHALMRPMKGTPFSYTFSCCICWRSSNASSTLPLWAHPAHKCIFNFGSMDFNW